MAELNGFQRNAAMARAMSGAKTMPVGMGNLTGQWVSDPAEVQLRAPPPNELARSVASRAAPGYAFPERQPWNAPTMSSVYDGLSQSPEFDPRFKPPRTMNFADVPQVETPLPRNVMRPGSRMDLLREPAVPADVARAIEGKFASGTRLPPNIGGGAGMNRVPLSQLAEGQVYNGVGAINRAAGGNYAKYLEGLDDVARGARDVMTSGAPDAAGALSAAAPVARASIPYARAALGAASRFAGPAYLAAAGYGLGKDAMDPNSALRQASAPAKADMRRDWAEGNYLSAIGDAVRATAATAPEVISQLFAPKPIFGGDNQRGLLQGLFGAERPEERNVRLAQEASPEGRYQAYLAAGGPANIDEFRQQRGSKASPAQAAPAARQPSMPMDVAKEWAAAIHAIAPKPKTYRDIAGENLLAIAAARAKQLPSLPEAQRQREQELIADLYGRVLNPQNAYGGNWLGNSEQ